MTSSNDLRRGVVWLATANPEKAAELARLLPPEVAVKCLLDLPAAERPVLPEEAPDFAGNARSKARAFAAFLAARGERGPAVVLADDSGLCVDALGGAPGARSARYAGPGAGDRERVRKLLAALAGVPPAARTARFVCAVHACRLDGRTLFALEADCPGRIAEKPAGRGGFGYDPIFVPDGADPPGRTFAELSPEAKDALSHRGRALRAAVPSILEALP